ADVGGEAVNVSRRHIAEIIEARMEEIFSMVDRELQHIDRAGLLPAGVILTGGGAKLPGLIEVGKKQFRLPVAIGFPVGYTSAIDKINDPAFTTALGLASWNAQSQSNGGKWHGITGKFSAVNDTVDTMRRWFKGFIP